MYEALLVEAQEALKEAEDKVNQEKTDIDALTNGLAILNQELEELTN